MSRKLVLIHGRSQQHKDAVALKAEWVQALTAGLRKSQLTLPLADAAIRFPFYGDTLYDLTQGLSAEEAANVVVRGGAGAVDADAQAFVREVLLEVQKAQGIGDAQMITAAGADVVQRGPLNWEWLQGVLKVLDRHVPLASGASVALATNDVYQYLSNPGIRDEIEAGVRQAMEPGVPTVVVSHSLGTVVAYNLLKREGADLGWQVPLFVTLGSPLAVKAIFKRCSPHRHPPCVGRWFNAMDERDVVALYPLDAAHFPLTPPISNKTDVDNFTDNRHGIAGYLSDPVVAATIHAALTG